MSRKTDARSLFWRDRKPNSQLPEGWVAIGAHHEYEIHFGDTGQSMTGWLFVDGVQFAGDDPDGPGAVSSTKLQEIANEHNRRAIKLKTPFRSPIAPAQTDFLVAAGQNKAKVGDLPLLQYRYLHDDLALVDYLADPAIPDWKNFAVMLTERGVEYLEWRDEQFRKRAPATWVTEREELRAALAQTKAAFDQVNPDLVRSEADLASLRRSMLVYEGRIGEFIALDRKKTTTIAALDDKIASLTRLNAETSRALELTREELASARTSHANIKTEFGAYRARINDERSKQERMFREAAFKQTFEEIAALKDAAHIATVEIERLNRELEEAMNVRGGLARSATEARSKLEQAETDLLNAQHALTERETDLTRIITHLRSELAGADETIIELTQDRNRLATAPTAIAISPQETPVEEPQDEQTTDYERKPDEDKRTYHPMRKHGFYDLSVGDYVAVTYESHPRFKKSMERFSRQSGRRFSLRKHEGAYRCLRIS